MNAELDYDLTGDQWEMLREFRAPGSITRSRNRAALEGLVALQLAEIVEGLPQIMPRGRSVLLRGSPRLWDVAA